MRIFESYKRFQDARGEFFGIINSGHWEEINFVETNAGMIRGGHYHKETRELFFIISGRIDITVESLTTHEEISFSVEKGSIFVIEPMEVHSFACKTDCSWINVLSKRLDDQFHDIYIP